MSHALQLRAPEAIPVCSISDLQWVMGSVDRVRVFSVDGQRSVVVGSVALLHAVNACMVMARALDLSLIELGDLLDEAEQAERSERAGHAADYARVYVKNRLKEAYWWQQARQIVHWAPEGSGTREALRYLLASTPVRDVLA